MTELEKMARAIRDLHGLQSTHVRSEPIRETFAGKTVWEGVVEVFSVRGHPRAGLVYAWSHDTDEGARRYVAVLGVPPVNTAVDAVRAGVMAEIKGRTPAGA
jgi:hypothetical protein